MKSPGFCESNHSHEIPRPYACFSHSESTPFSSFLSFIARPLPTSCANSLVVEARLNAPWYEIERPAHHSSGNPAVFESGRVGGGREIIRVSAELICNPCQLRVIDNSRPRHYGIASLVGVVFTAGKSLHVISRFLPNREKELTRKRQPRLPSCASGFHSEHLASS